MMPENEPSTLSDPARNMAMIYRRIEAAAKDAGRSVSDITLVAVSKRQVLARVEALLEAGHRVFGENRVQEATGKWPDLKAQYAGVELHMVGPLQSNKVEEAVALFDVIHSLDRPKLARKLSEAIAQAGRTPRLFVQINTGEEPQKSGVKPADLKGFMSLCTQDLGLVIDGFMCLPPAGSDPAPHFMLLQKLKDQYGLEKLSMGMSGDFETAIEHGATHIRLGTSLFGKRDE